MPVRWITRILLLLFYSIPYAFLAIYGDVRFRTMWFYLIMIVAFTTLAIIAHLTKNEVVVIIGNVLSVISSFTALAISGIGPMGWYCKPLTTHALIAFFSLFAIAAQFPSAIVRIVKRREKTRYTTTS